MGKYLVINSWVQVMDCSQQQEIEADSPEDAVKLAIEKDDWKDYQAEESGAISLNRSERGEIYRVEDEETGNFVYEEEA